jgi:hypothetical protein
MFQRKIRQGTDELGPDTQPIEQAKPRDLQALLVPQIAGCMGYKPAIYTFLITTRQ